MINKPLLIIGGPGHGSVIASCIENSRKYHNNQEWDIKGFINDFETTVDGYPVIGGTDKIKRFVDNGYYFAWGIHLILRNIKTFTLFSSMNIPTNRLATIVHPSAFISKDVELSPGVFVMCNAYIGPRSKLGIGTMVKANAQIGHDVECGPLCHFAMGSTTGSYVKLGTCCDIATGSVVLEHKQIGDYAIAGAGSVVTHNIPDYEIHVGNPAKFLKNIRKD